MDIWEKLENESDRAYQAFTIYRNMNKERTLDGAWEIFSSDLRDTSYDTFRAYSTKFQWAKRARAWDAHVLSLESEASEKELIKARNTERKNRLEMLKVLRALSAKAANSVLDTDKQGNPIISKSADMKNVAAIVQMYLEQSRLEMGERAIATQKEANVTINNNLELGDAIGTAKDRLQSLLSQKSIDRTTSGDNERLQ